MSTLQAHPAAELFPLLSGDEYESFKADIAERGLIEPIWLCEGKILDGRNRYRACNELGVEPKFLSYDGESPVAFAWSLNGKRRHLDKGQLAIIATKMLPPLREEAKKRQLAALSGVPVMSREPADEPQNKHANMSVTKAAEIVGVGESLVQRADYLAKNAPEMLEKVQAGEATINGAYTKVRKNKPEPAPKPSRSREARIEQIRVRAAEGYLASQIGAEIGMSAPTVRRYAAAAGITLADKQLGHIRKIDARHVIETTVFGLEGNKIVFDTIRGGDWDITAQEAKEWHTSLGKSIKELHWLRNKLGVIANGN